MHNLLRYYRRNRKKIITVILGIIFVISLIQLLNYIVESDSVKKSTSINSSMNNTTINTKVEKTVIEGKKVPEKKVEEVTTIIKQFFQYCNAGDVEGAYELLSEQCKQVMYPTKEEFYENYYLQIFTEEKTYDLYSWISQSDFYTYKVTIMQDALSTGSISKNKKIDYFTIVKENDNDIKININSYIGRIKIGKELEKDNTKIKINYKDIYMNYEVYNISVENHSKNTISLSKAKGTDSIYLEDSNGITYSAYLYEIPNESMNIKPRNNKYIKY